LTELSEIYSDRILTLAANMPAAARLAEPQATARAHSKLCGSTVIVDLSLADGLVTEYGHEVKACLLGQCAAAVMAQNAVGSSVEELREVRDQMLAMLKDNGPAPTGRWADLQMLEPVRDFKARHTSTMLVFEAVCEAIDRI